MNSVWRQSLFVAGLDHRMDCRTFAAPKRLRPRRRIKTGNDDYI
jgi:hypothetical protein